MPSKKRGSGKKRQASRRTSKLYIYRFWLPNPDERYIPRRSSVFNDVGLDFVKSYEHLHDFYLKRLDGKPPLIKHAELAYYLDVALLQKRGQWYSLEEYAKHRAINHETVTAWTDNLENINLLHRERRMEGSEHSIAVVLHTPLPLDTLRQQHAELLARREKPGYIQTRRAEAGRNKRDWLPKAFAWKKMLNAFDGREKRAELFENIVGDIVYQHIADRDFSRQQFWEEVVRACMALKLEINEEAHMRLAFEIKAYIERV